MEDLGTGEYRARFAAVEAGTYALSVQHAGCNIGGSPLCMQVGHGAIAADCCYVVQEGMERAVAGRQVRRKAAMTLSITTLQEEGPLAAVSHGSVRALL